MSVRLPREGHLPPSPHSPEPRARPSKTAASEREGAAREGADHDASPFARTRSCVALRSSSTEYGISM